MSTSHEQQLRDALRILKKAIVFKESGFPAQKIEHFVTCTTLLEKLLKEYYWNHFSAQDVPEQGQADTVLTELVAQKKIPQEHAIELLEQFTTASLLAASNWLASQPATSPHLQEYLDKIPHYHASMTAFLALFTTLN